MKIYELTHLSPEQLDEAQGMITGLYDLAKSFSDPRMKGMPAGARMKAMAGDRSVALIAKAAYSQWIQKVAQLQKQQLSQFPVTQKTAAQPAAKATTTATTAPATAAPAATPAAPVAEAKQPNYVDIGATAYQKYLTDFVNTAMFRGDMSYLEPESKANVDQVIKNIVAVRDDPAAIEKAFAGLALVAANAMFTSPQYQKQHVKDVTTTGKSAAPAGPVTTDTVKSMLSQLGVAVNATPRSFGQVFTKASGNKDLRIDNTGNEYANALLQLFGFEIR